MVGEFLRRVSCIVVIRDSDQDEDMETRNSFEVTITAEFATLPQLLDRWNCIPVLFLDVFIRRILNERTVDELAERFLSLVVFFEIFQ